MSNQRCSRLSYGYDPNLNSFLKERLNNFDLRDLKNTRFFPKEKITPKGSSFSIWRNGFCSNEVSCRKFWHWNDRQNDYIL
jgi:hypothetical protein